MGPNTTGLEVALGAAHGDLNESTGDGLPTLPRPQYPDPHVVRMHAVLYVLHSYYQPSIIGLGLVFNMVALLVLLLSKLTSLSSTRYLVASTAVDLLYLSTLLVTWLAERGVPVYQLGAFCHLTTFFQRAAAFLSTWYAVGLSVDRFLSICLPGWERQLCSPTRANVVIVSLGMLALVVYLNISLTVGVVRLGLQYICTPLHIFMAALRALDRADAVINILLPYSLLVLLWVLGAVRSLIGRSSVEVARRRPVVTRNRVCVETSAVGLSDGQNAAYFLYILTLLLLTCPLQVERCRQTLRGLMSPPDAGRPPSPSAMLLLRLLHYPYYTRFCLNFFICFSAHRGFRLAMGDVARRLGKRCRAVSCCRPTHRDNKIRSSASTVSLEDLQEEEQSRVALCAGEEENACSAV